MKSTSVEEINQKANQCVKCGLCLNHCPTFQVTQDENRSPRGRIALIQAVNTHTLPVTDKLITHLDSCLQCLACESVCPAEVDYQALIKHAHETIVPPSPLPWFYRLVTQPNTRYVLQGLLWLQDSLGFRKLARNLGFIKKLKLTLYDALLPKVPRPFYLRDWYPTTSTSSKERRTVTLWCGCITPLTQPQLIQRTITLLNRLDYDVRLAKVCCGALWSHTGNTKQAENLYQQHQAFKENDNEPWISLNSGCGAHLTQIHKKPVQDISHFLLEHKAILRSQLKSLVRPVTLHTPCTLHYPLAAGSAPYQLLSLIPNLQITSLNPSGTCCGGAGYAMLKYPEQAARILDQYAFERDASSMQVVATSNTGCLLHLRQYAHSRNVKMQLLHPVDCLYLALQTIK